MEVLLRSLIWKLAKAFRAIWQHAVSLLVRLYLRAIGVELPRSFHASSFPICRRHRQARIVLGEGVTLRSRLSENLAGIYHKTVLVADGPGTVLEIGACVGISGAVIYASERITIEPYVQVGVGACIYDTDFHPLDWQARRNDDMAQVHTAPVLICQDAWIGAHAMILKGVTIGERSIIAAGSVVTCEVPADCIFGGVPARMIRSLK